MTGRTIFKRAISLILGSAMALQGCFVMPAHAETRFTYNFYYSEGNYMTEDVVVDDGQGGTTTEIKDNPIIIPDEELDGGQASLHQGLVYFDNEGVLGEPIPTWGPEPYRIIGYTFDGWFIHMYPSYDPGDTRQGDQITENTPIEQRMLHRDFNELYMYSYWSKYKSPYLAENTLKMTAKNTKKEPLGDITITDTDEGKENIQNGKYDYKGEVYGNYNYLNMEFEVYEPDFESVTVKLNGEDVALDPAKRRDVLTQEAYVKGDGNDLQNKPDTVKGVVLGTVDDAMELQSGDNVIEITVTLPEVVIYDLRYTYGTVVQERYQESKTYTITVKRLPVEIVPTYGNSPYGEIIRRSIDPNLGQISEERMQELRDTFESTYKFTYSNKERYYSPKAWDMQLASGGEAGTEIIKGSTPSAGEYINYDKDENALFVYAGNTFTDTGITVYDSNGDVLNLDDEHTIKRDIWDKDGTQIGTTTVMNGSENENNITLPKNIKAGIYTLKYTYESPYGNVEMTKNMIVLPNPGDLNMDGYTNSLDVDEYSSVKTTFTSLADSIYTFRAMDLDYDGEAGSSDAAIVKARSGNMPYYYRDLSVYPENTKKPYTPSDDGTKAQMTMEYLGKGNTPQASKVTQSSEDTAADEAKAIEAGETFWIGLKLTDIDKADEFTKGINSMTLSLDYDQRYLMPANDWITKIKANNTGLADFSFSGITNNAASYTYDNSTADTEWSDITQVKTAVLDMYKGSSLYNVGEGEYLIKIPFTVKLVPPKKSGTDEYVNVLSAKLGANTLNISFGENGGDYREMWDTSDSLNDSTANMMSRIDYMGDCTMLFGKEAEVISLNEVPQKKSYTYGTYLSISALTKFRRGKLDGDLPKGLKYTQNLGKIDGTPEEVGTIIFYIGGQPYSITIDKATLTVTAEDKTKTYGDANPELTYTNSGIVTSLGDDFDTVLSTKPTLTCDSAATQYGNAEAVAAGTAETAEIVVSGGAFGSKDGKNYSDYYNLVLKNGTLSVNEQREIKVTGINDIPPLTPTNIAKAIENGQSSFTFPNQTAVYGSDGFTAALAEGSGDAVVNNDKLKITYDVTYNSLDSAEVTISNLKLVTDEEGYERGKNYEIKSYPENMTGSIKDKTVTRLRPSIRNNLKTQYTYGETLDMSGLKLTIQYDDGNSDEITFAQLKNNPSEREIKATYLSAGDYTGEEVRNEQQLDVKNFDSFSIHFEFKDDSSISADTNTITVAKNNLRLKITDVEKTYGEENSVLDTKYGYEIVTDDLVSWDKSKTKATLEGLTAPAIVCSSTIDETTEVGTYDNVITASGSVSDNYNILYVNKNLESKGAALKINQREISIGSIDPDTVPSLEFDDYNGKTAPFYANGSAYYNDDEDKTITSMSGHVNGDKIKIHYKTKYADNNATHGDSTVNVDITDVKLDTDGEYSRGKNYYLASSNPVTDSSHYQYKGKVHSGSYIKSLSFDPSMTLKTSYIYGERLDFTTKNIVLTYDDGSTVNVSLADILSNYTDDLKVEYNEQAEQRVPTANDKLIVGDERNTIRIFHNPEEYLPFDEYDPIEIPLTINKKTVHVAAEYKTMIYGNNPPEYTYVFTESDFDDDFGNNEYKATKAEREAEISGWTDPGITAKENNNITDVSSATKLGTYNIILSGGSADNYKFEFTNNSIKINQRPLSITDITEVPVLTAERVYKNNYTFDDLTEILNSEGGVLTSSGLVNDDTVRITYSLRYDTSETGENKRVVVYKYSIGNANDEYNYYISSFVPRVNNGVVKGEHLVSVDVIGEPEKDDYIYGETLDFSQYKARLTYDSTRTADVDFEDLSSYGVSVSYTKLKDNGQTVTAADGDLMAPSVNVEDDTLTLTYNSWDLTREEYDEKTTATTAKINVSKKLMHVIVNDAPNVIYGVNPALSYSYDYNTEDFADVDKAQGRNSAGFRLELVSPTLSAYDGDTEITNGKNIGTYTNAIRVSNKEYAGSANYYFDMEDTGTLTINKRFLKITSINNIPELTREQVINNNYAERNTISNTAWGSSDYDTELSFADRDTETGIFGNDTIGIRYTAVYNNISASDSTEVDIEYDEDTWLDTVRHPKGANYRIEKPSKAYGSVSSSIISGIEIAEEPKMQYNYGESFKLSGSVNMIYDSGERVPCDFDKLSDYGAVAVFADKTGGSTGAALTPEEAAVRDSRTLTVSKHNGKCIKVMLEDRPSVYVESDNVLEITPHEMHIIMEPQSSVYGDAVVNVANSYHYNTEDLVNGDSLESENFRIGLKNPTVYCDEVTNASPAGTYKDAIKGKDAESVNYTFTYVPADYTVEKRPVTVHAIKSGIPALIAQQISDEPGNVHKIEGVFAASDDADHLAEIYNMLIKDRIAITYTVVYNSIEPSRNVTVDIEDIAIDEDYYESKNYYLSETEPSVTSSPGGVITYRSISNIIILQQPKLEYTYGEVLNLETGKIRVEYDVGGYDEYTFNEIPSSEMTLTYSNGSTARNKDILNVNDYNGLTMTLRAIGLPSVTPRTTEPIIVNKKPLNVDADAVTVTYGEPVNYSWSYRASDFVNNEYIVEDETSEDFLDGLKAPKLSCLDSTNHTAGELSDAGEYDIVLSGGEAKNYEFVYNNSLLTINRRTINVNAISNIPMLTAQFRSNNPGPPYYVPARAISSLGQASVSNLINGDDVAVTYSAVYFNGTPTASVSVGLNNIEMDDTYGKSSNYVLAYKAISSPYGSVNDSDINELRIITMPEMQYAYGEQLRLDDGILRIYYDDGTSVNASFADLRNYGLSFKYTGTDTDVENGTVLNIDDYNGLTFDIKVLDSIYDVADITTDPLSVTKRVLRYGECPVESIVYDGTTTLTDGTITFANVYNNEPVHATGVFNFTDANAGTNKTVNITDIVLDDEWTEHYQLSADYTTAHGTIEKAQAIVPDGDITTDLSDETNTLVVNAPPLTRDLRVGGAEYEYSIDGGETWLKSNVFLTLALEQKCEVCVRIAESDNYIRSEQTEPVNITAYKNRLRLICTDDPIYENEEKVKLLFNKYTNVEGFVNEAVFRSFVGDVTSIGPGGTPAITKYYALYTNEGKTNAMQFPYTLKGDTLLYTTFQQTRGYNRGSGGGGGGGGGASLSIKYENDDGSAGSSVSVIETTTDTETITLIGDTGGSNTSVVWTSDNENIAEVNDGIVTIKDTGTVVITAYLKNNKSVKDTVTITIAEPAAPTPVPSSSPSPIITPTPEPTPDASGSLMKNIPYLHGFEGKINPDDYMTRAEAATIMVQLTGSTGEKYENNFPDVREGTWYIDIIAEAAARGLVSGFEDGNFYPEETVTREQFTAMVARLVKLEPVEGQSFEDVKSDRWSAGYINASVEKGIIKGYNDGTFMPENPIRRSEAARIVNIATNRIYDTEFLDTLECPFSDLTKNHWAYYEFIIAAVEFDIPQ